MTLTRQPKLNKSLGNQIPESVKNAQTVLALKRYLDLTLTGTKKNLADHGNRGRKGHPPSPYSFDKPELESTIQKALKEEHSGVLKVGKPPRWVQRINERICKHTGEAPMFSESLLPSNKAEQTKPVDSRPMSGLSTKSAPVFINGEMYYRPNSKYTYLQASSRPFSAKEERVTRATVLRNKHRMQVMAVLPSCDTQQRFREMKSAKPRMQKLNKDLLPIPCHTGETPHSFIVGARYNRCNHMDARSYSRLGLYVPRRNPQKTFLKSYKIDEAGTETTESDSDYVGFTSARMGMVSDKTTQCDYSFAARKPPQSGFLPPPHVRKVVHEVWLTGETSETEAPKPSSGQRRSSSKRSSASDKRKSNKSDNLESKSPSRASTVLSRKSRSRSKTPDHSRFDVKGRPAPTSDADLRSRSSLATKQAELE